VVELALKTGILQVSGTGFGNVFETRTHSDSDDGDREGRYVGGDGSDGYGGRETVPSRAESVAELWLEKFDEDSDGRLSAAEFDRLLEEGVHDGDSFPTLLYK
jgi:hypothetical protein